MRVLVSLAFPPLLLFAASCGGGNGDPTAVPTAPELRATDGPVPSPEASQMRGVEIYRNDQYRFELQYPAGAPLRNPNVVGFPPWVEGRNGVRIDLAVPAGTNLSGKYLIVSARQASPGACLPPEVAKEEEPEIETVTIDTVPFRTHKSVGAAASEVWDVTTYWASRGDACVIIDTVLDSYNPGSVAGPTPLPFDPKQEHAAFQAVLSTFRWLD
jgi:hypothetical protein